MKVARGRESSGSAGRMLASLVLPLLISCWVVAPPAPALAGEVTARLCPGSSTASFAGRFVDSGGRPWLEIGAGCHAAGNGIAGLYQDRDGASASFGQSGSIVWEAPPEVSIVEATGRVRMKDANGFRTALTGNAGGVLQKVGEGSTLGGSALEFTWPRSGSLGSSLGISIECLRSSASGGCENERDSVRSFAQIESLEMTGRDDTPPLVGWSGDFLERSGDGRWSGTGAGWSASAWDQGTGVADLYFLVNGYEVLLSKITCPGLAGGHSTELSPCPSARHQTGMFDTTSPPFREGVNGIRLCSVDFSSDSRTANRACSERVELKVDTGKPDAPIELTTDRGSGWSARDRFTVSWSLPEDRGSPLDRAFYRLRSASSGEVVAAGTMPADPNEAGPDRELTVKEAGDYRLEVGLTDAAGNNGGVSTTPVRFDDRPPPNVVPVVPEGWVSRSELPLPASVEAGHGSGPSGIAGYAFATSDLEPLKPCGSSLCRLSELSWLGGPDDGPALLDGLSEGENFVSVAAVSGAFVPSRDPGTASVKVDLTDPVVRVEGNPRGWSNRPVTLSAVASDRLSGMVPDPEDDDVPMTGIGITGSDPEVRIGGRSTITVGSEGQTEVEYFANDLAGNSTTDAIGKRAVPDRVTVRIDTTPPSIEFGESAAPGDPERVVVNLADVSSGVVDGEISIGPKGPRAGFETLATVVESDRLEARIPSDLLPPGEYVLRAEATDAAGNRSVETSDGTLRLPLKAAATISLDKGTPEPTPALFSDRKEGTVVSGRLSVASGQLDPEATVKIEEVFPDGSGLGSRSTPVTVQADGRFSVSLMTGPSRRVRAVFEGDRLNRRASSRWVSLAFSDRVTFSVRDRVTRNRAPTRMVGTVSGRGASVPSGGKKVVIEYFDPSRRSWRPVEVVTTRSTGRFTFTYRFRTITSPQRISFRAASLGEVGWPFRPSASRPVTVTVLP